MLEASLQYRNCINDAAGKSATQCAGTVSGLAAAQFEAQTFGTKDQEFPMPQTASKLKLKDTDSTDLLAIVAELGPSLAGNASQADANDQFVAENFKTLRRSGLVEAAVPLALGGGGAGIAELAQMLKAMSHHCPSTALAFAMHTHQVAIPAWRWQHQQVKAVEPLLQRVAQERLILLSSGGSDWVAGSGKATRVEGGYEIKARKVFASAAPAGDLLMTMAVDDSEHQVLHFALPMTSPHVTIEPTWKALGMRGTGSHDVVIDGHLVPDAAVSLKRKAAEWHPVFHVIATIAIPLIYAVYVGVAEQARDTAVKLASKRRLDAHVTHSVGLLDNELLGARLALQHMLSVAERNAPSAAAVNETMQGRALAVAHVLRAVELAMEAAGGAGFYRDNGLERLFRDAQGARYHPMQGGHQADYAGAMALGLPVERIF
jgi:indole-3-acetate monooxygenase